MELSLYGAKVRGNESSIILTNVYDVNFKLKFSYESVLEMS